MTADVISCAPDDDLTEVMRTMTERRIRHLPVLEDRVLAGILSIGDLVKYRLGELENDAEALREYIAQA
jgi:CBS domain-containing protein